MLQANSTHYEERGRVKTGSVLEPEGFFRLCAFVYLHCRSLSEILHTEALLPE